MTNNEVQTFVRPSRSALGIFYSICFAQFIVPYMVSSVSLALPTIGRDLNASAVQLGLVEQFYLIAMVMTLLIFGRLGDLLGRGRVYSAGFLVFSICTVSLGFMTDIRAFLALRCLQGCGAASLLSLSNALLVSLFPPNEQGRRLGILSIFIYAGLSTGPFLGGAIVTHFGWRALFWSLGPLAGFVSVFCLWNMWNECQKGQAEGMDWKGGILYAISMCLFMWGASRVVELWGAIAFFFGMAGLVLFCRFEQSAPMPLVNVSLLARNRFFSYSLLAAMGNYASTTGMTFFIGLYLQYVQGFSPQAAGLLMLIQPAAQMLAAPFAGKLIDRSLIERERLANIGILLTTVALIGMMITTGTAVSLYFIPAELLLVGIGYGSFIVPNTVIIMRSVEKRHIGMASSMVAVMRNLGMTVSMTCVTLILTIFMGASRVTAQTVPEFMTSMRASLALCAFFALAGFLSSFARGARRPE